MFAISILFIIQLRQEVVEVVGQLRVMVDQLRHKRRNSLTSLSTNSSDELTSANLKVSIASTRLF